MNQVAIDGFFRDTSEQPCYMALTIGNLVLLTASADVISIESIDDIERSAPADDAKGSIHYYDQDIPAYSLAENLDPEPSGSGDETLCVVLKQGTSFVALMCRKATPFEHPIIRSLPLPECMRARPTPINMLCQYRNGGTDDVACVINANSIIDFINDSHRNGQDVDHRRQPPL